MDRAEPILLPVFFATLLHAAGLLLILSVSEPQGNSLIESEDLSAISVNARAVTLPKPKPVVQPKPKPKPKPKQPVVAKESTSEKVLQEPEATEEPQEETDEATEDDTVADIEEPTQETPIKDTQSEEEISASQRNQALAYYGRNRDLVERNFYAGTTAQREQFKGLVTRLKLFLDERGYLQRVEVVSGSGSDLFDSEAVRAVRRVDRFIIPDDAILRQRYFREITMEFNLDK